ncbi:unnamed protein product [Menidia menidia]|uniref:(Atlantic silverside) hypothetical protein n=1 Tax=Menidia menidia TaxID=238744 RepID=A0A8S4BS99_9TELE|nr:unnamed protein product [Menidia menidia]
MSVPFSNTHLRVPRGFGTILEGLAREVLRDQPEDIAAFAAQYFDALLKQREESGVDPAEWAARLEDRFYNNHAFKHTERSPEKEMAPEMSVSKDKSYESLTEDESSHLVEACTTQPSVTEWAESSERTDHEEEEEKDNDDKEIRTVSAETEPSERKCVSDILSNESVGTDTEKDPTITTLDQVDRPDMKIDSQPVPDQNVPQADSEPTDSFPVREAAHVDVCAQELGAAEAEGGDQQGGAPPEKDILESQVKDTEVDLAAFLQSSGLAEVDICAGELGGTEKTTEAETIQQELHVTEEEESLKHQVEATSEQLCLSQNAVTHGSQQEAEGQAQERETEASGRLTNESLAHTDCASEENILSKEDYLVEVSFDDVPETDSVREKHPEEEASVEILQINMEQTQPTEESTEIMSHSEDQDITNAGDDLQPEMENETEHNDEEREMEGHHSAFDMSNENVETNNSHVNDLNDGEKEEGVKNIHSFDQPNTEEKLGIQEDETSHKSKDTGDRLEYKFNHNQEHEIETQPNDADFKEETTDSGGGDEEETQTLSYSEMRDEKNDNGKWERRLSQDTDPNTSAPGSEEKNETCVESSEHPPPVSEASQRTLGASQPEDTTEEKEIMLNRAQEHALETTDSEVQERRETMEDRATVGLSQSADWTTAGFQEEERSAESEKDTVQLASKSKEEECSRPQEEEDIMDIPLDDPEANRAAAKIQAGFRGHMTRKKMKPEDKAEGEEVSSTGEVLNGSQGVSETGRSGAVEGDDTSVPEQ